MKALQFSALAAAAALGMAAPAHAVVYNNFDPVAGTGGFGDTNTPGSGQFTSTFTFTVLQAGTLSTYVQNLSALPVGDIDFLSAVLTGPTFPSGQAYTFTTLAFGGNADGNEQGVLYSALIAPGTYTLTVQGVAGQTASYTGDFTVTPGLVPEPATWGLMIGGIGLTGGALRRRKASLATA